MKSIHPILLGTLCLLGIALFFVRTDRPTIHLAPTPGAQNILTINANKTYEFQFQTNLPRITRIGLYLTPLEKSIPAAPVTLQIYRANELLGEGTMSSAFIDQEHPLQWRFSPFLPSTFRETLTAKILVPPELAEKVGLKIRVPDGTFKHEDTILKINGQSQPAPAAYEVYTDYVPPLAPQLGSLFIGGAIIGFIAYRTKKSISSLHLLLMSLILSSVANLPATLLGGNPLSLIIIQAAAWYLMGTSLRLKGHSVIASVAGASVFAFTSWFALQVASDRALYGLVSLLPLISIWRHRNMVSSAQRMHIGILIMGILAVTIISGTELPNSLPSTPASIRDSLFDPNQIPTAVKTADNTPWNHFGGYIGLIAGAISCIGIVSSRRQWPTIVALIVAGLFVFTPVAYNLPLPVSPAHAIIIIVYFLALFVAAGLDRLRLFLGVKDAIVTGILIVITSIIMLDLWQVATPILELPHLL